MDCLSAYKPRMHVHMTSTQIRAEIQKIVLTGCISVSVTRGGIQHFADFICEFPLGRSCVFVPRASAHDRGHAQVLSPRPSGWVGPLLAQCISGSTVLKVVVCLLPVPT